MSFRAAVTTSPRREQQTTSTIITARITWCSEGCSRLLSRSSSCSRIRTPRHGPNLSGTWTLTVKSGFCAGSLTILQDEASLRVQPGSDAGTDTFRFDGTDTHEVVSPAPPRSANVASTAFEGHKTKSVARAAWNGDQFIVVIHATMTMTWPSQMSGDPRRHSSSGLSRGFTGRVRHLTRGA